MFFWSSSSASWCLGFAELVCSSLGVRVCFLASFERAYWTWTACENHSFLLRYFGQTFFHSLFFSAEFSFNNLSKFANEIKIIINYTETTKPVKKSRPPDENEMNNNAEFPRKKW